MVRRFKIPKQFFDFFFDHTALFHAIRNFRQKGPHEPRRTGAVKTPKRPQRGVVTPQRPQRQRLNIFQKNRRYDPEN